MEDILVSKPGAGSGQVYVYVGSSSTMKLSSTLNSNGAIASFVDKVRFAGDVDGDGFDDVAVGNGYHSDSIGGEGAVHLFRCSETGVASTPAWSAVGTQQNEYLGRALAPAGDVDQDGFDDLVVGAPGYDDGADIDKGRALVFLGTSGGLETTPGWETSGEEGWSFGEEVEGLGDIDQDGWPEIAVAAPDFDERVCVFSAGPDGDNDGEVALTDCDDMDSTVNASATEHPGDGFDQNCDGQEACYLDNDGDGYGAETTLSADLDCEDPREAALGGDCIDYDAAIAPGFTESCDGKDNDCDGIIDEGFVDTDGDGTPDCADSDDDDCTREPMNYVMAPTTIATGSWTRIFRILTTMRFRIA